MTMQAPAATAPKTVVPLPEPGFPMVTRMISNALFPDSGSRDFDRRRFDAVLGQQDVMGAMRLLADALSAPRASESEPITWIVGQAHPLVPDMKVMRMFVDRGGVEVYSVSGDGKAGMRNLVPMSWIRLIEEAMPLDVFIEELAAAEEDEELEPEPEPPPEPGSGPEPEPVPANGQSPS